MGGEAVIVLGLHTGHDGAACIVRDGRLVAALATERLSRQKKCFGISPGVIDYVLKAADVTVEQIDAVGLSDWNRDYAFGAIEAYRGGAMLDCLWNTVYGNEVVESTAVLRGRSIPAYSVGHQLCHAASAYYTSPFQDAYTFTLDASGAKLKNNSLVCHGVGNKLEALPDPGLMVGCAYGHVCEQLGIGMQIFKAGAMMGLSSHGSVSDAVKARLAPHIDRAFCTYDSEHHAWMDLLWRDLSGQESCYPPQRKDSPEAMNIAAAMQWLFEQCILKAVDAIQADGCPNLCLSGGSMLNCNANSAILAQGKFPNLHLFPACSDDGGAVGMALYIAHHIFDEPREPYEDREICYLGAERPLKATPDLGFLAHEIANGKIVAWCNGRSEYGPRALGNRSILADPRVACNHNRINTQIKNREWFRPVAPVVLEEDAQDWFEFDRPSPFMLFTARCKQPEAIPAVTHVDGSSRMQTVSRSCNPLYYDLIREFKAITGVPVLINTSLNVDGEPMVETAEDALRLWDKTPVDILVLDGEILTR